MRTTTRRLSLWLLLLAAPGCMVSPVPGDQGMRSPTLDYPPPEQTADGHVLGADRIPAENKLRSGPRLGTGDTTPTESKQGEPPRDPLCDTPAALEAVRRDRCKDKEAKPR